MIGVCFLVWCLGQSPMSFEGITFTHDVRGKTVTERIVGAEFRWAMAGFVQQRSRDALFGGLLPLSVKLLHGHISMDGGVVVASADVPGTGTRANFMTRAQFDLTHRFAITYRHWSNASLSRRNPGMDAAGATVRFGLKVERR